MEGERTYRFFSRFKGFGTSVTVRGKRISVRFENGSFSTTNAGLAKELRLYADKCKDFQEIETKDIKNALGEGEEEKTVVPDKVGKLKKEEK